MTNRLYSSLDERWGSGQEPSFTLTQPARPLVTFQGATVEGAIVLMSSTIRTIPMTSSGNLDLRVTPFVVGKLSSGMIEMSDPRSDCKVTLKPES
jgi:hypothetical protein